MIIVPQAGGEVPTSTVLLEDKPTVAVARCNVLFLSVILLTIGERLLSLCLLFCL